MASESMHSQEVTCWALCHVRVEQASTTKELQQDLSTRPKKPRQNAHEVDSVFVLHEFTLHSAQDLFCLGLSLDIKSVTSWWKLIYLIWLKEFVQFVCL